MMIIGHQQRVQLPQIKSENPFTARSADKLVSTEQVEFIPTYLTSEIVLKVE